MNLKSIVRFEHEKLIFNLKNEDEKKLHDALENYYGNYSPFFKLIKNGVQFNEHVGVLQIGRTKIEILPKADKNGEEKWRGLLIDMIRTVWGFNVKSTGSSTLKLKSNSILDLYFELFINELELIFHRGLIKKYSQTDVNLQSLKGSLQFSKHISKNCTHQERFYVKYSHYDKDHLIHQILFKALNLINQINTTNSLKSKIGTLLLDFPEVSNIKISETVFSKINYDRKNIHYKTALEIAKLVLLNYHPDLSKGKNNVLALMFDMNSLWEQFIFMTLHKKMKTHQITSQVTKYFWKPTEGSLSKMRPDLILKNRITQETIVLDTKWKNLNGRNPSPEDLRQMYVYHKYYDATKTALVYPGEEHFIKRGNYFNTEIKAEISLKECSIVHVKTVDEIGFWQDEIVEQIKSFLR